MLRPFHDLLRTTRRAAGIEGIPLNPEDEAAVARFREDVPHVGNLTTFTNAPPARSIDSQTAYKPTCRTGSTAPELGAPVSASWSKQVGRYAPARPV